MCGFWLPDFTVSLMRSMTRRYVPSSSRVVAIKHAYVPKLVIRKVWRAAYTHHKSILAKLTQDPKTQAKAAHTGLDEWNGETTMLRSTSNINIYSRTESGIDRRQRDTRGRRAANEGGEAMELSGQGESVEILPSQQQYKTRTCVGAWFATWVVSHQRKSTDEIDRLWLQDEYNAIDGLGICLDTKCNLFSSLA